MSGFEPVIAEAALGEVGTTALTSEVMASNALAAANTAAYTPAAVGSLASIPAGLGALMGGAAPTLGSAASGGIPTILEQLTTTNPEVVSQLQNTLRPAMFEGLNPTSLDTLSPERLAQITNIPTFSPGVQVADAFGEEALRNITPEMLDPNLVQSAVPELTPEKLTELATQNDALARTAAQYPAAPGSPSGLGGMFKDFMAMPMKDKMLYGGVASLAAPTIMGMLKKKKPLGGAEPYSGPLSKFQYDPSRYTPLQATPPTPYQARYAQGGLSDLGGYSDGGRMLKGPGDGMSDDIPASIADKQPARLANEEFVIPADVVSHLGNGSSEAGAKQLYKMMDKVRQARTGNKAQGKQIKADKYMPV
jgi:hypothetical protein